MFLKDFIGKKVLSAEGKILGYSRSALFSANYRRITALLCSDGEEEDFFFPLSPTQKADDALIMPRRKMAKVTGMPYSPALKQVYTPQGRFIGFVDDVKIKNLAVAALVVDKTEYPAEQIKAFGDCILLDVDKRPAKKQAKKRDRASCAALPLGRTLRADVANETDGTGAPLFCKGTLVTPQVMQLAEEKKKILEVTAKTFAP